MEENIEQQVEEKMEMAEEVDEPINDRSDLTIDKFMDDMSMLGTQVRDPRLKKPTFHYGDVSVTNYLLWLMLGELQILNDSLKEE